MIVKGGKRGAIQVYTIEDRFHHGHSFHDSLQSAFEFVISENAKSGETRYSVGNRWKNAFEQYVTATERPAQPP